MTDLSAQLVVSRDTVQAYTAALRALTDSDLTDVVRSPSWQPRVDSSPDPPAHHLADTGLRHLVMTAAVDCHHAAIALCAIDAVDDPLPWGDPPIPDRRVLPPVTELHRHARHLDVALAQVQRTHLPAQDDRDHAADACHILTTSDALTYQPKDTTQPRRIRWTWLELAATLEPTCHLCGRLDVIRRHKLDRAGTACLLNDRVKPVYERIPVAVIGRVCAHCRAQALNQPDPQPEIAARTCIECGRDVQDRGTRCWACRKARQRASENHMLVTTHPAGTMSHVEVGIAMPDTRSHSTRTTRCATCGRGDVQVDADHTGPVRCDDCVEAA